MINFVLVDGLADFDDDKSHCVGLSGVQFRYDVIQVVIAYLLV